MNSTEKVMKFVDEVQYPKGPVDEILNNDIHLENSTNKHQVTPLKTKSKTSRSENKEDVHSSPTPVTPRSKLSKSQVASPQASSLASAYYADVCSEEFPEVIWDYTSPKQNKGLKKTERTIMIDDLLQNMQCENKVSCINSKTSENLQILEKWMRVRSMSPTLPRVQRKTFQKKMSKKPSRHLMEEVETVMNSLNNAGFSSNSENISDNVSPKVNKNLTELQQQLKNDCVIEEAYNSLDSSDEMWGCITDEDDFIIVKATQEFESCLINSQNDFNIKSMDQRHTFASLIPETIEKDVKFHSLLKNVHSDSKLMLNKETESVLKKQLLSEGVEKKSNTITMIEKNDPCVHKNSLNSSWDPEFDSVWNDDILESETLSQIPDDLLLGKVANCFTQETCVNKDFKIVGLETVKQISHKAERDTDQINKCILATNEDLSKRQEKKTTASSRELFQELDCDPFNDDFELNEPEFFTLLDRMESQSTLKCTPEEIAQKKDDARKRLKHNHKKDH